MKINIETILTLASLVVLGLGFSSCNDYDEDMKYSEQRTVIVKSDKPTKHTVRIDRVFKDDNGVRFRVTGTITFIGDIPIGYDITIENMDTHEKHHFKQGLHISADSSQKLDKHLYDDRWVEVPMEVLPNLNDWLIQIEEEFQ